MKIQCMSYRIKFKILMNPNMFLIILACIIWPIIKYFGIAILDLRTISFSFGFVVLFYNFVNTSMRNLFDILSEFNKRYNQINQSLVIDERKMLRGNAVIDYLNLCAEEYYFYKHGMIPHEVWICWVYGMKGFFENEDFKGAVNAELKNRKSFSYYGFDPIKLNIFKLPEEK
jgi:hypothetical protein